ncbi:MAG: cupin domain-containing protein [Phycisphaerales bacterium]|nr:cupin domain-containing protein [Phycisphaerae bacterium]NNF42253.1 cupin domain-containing protein [Phycisphaerales bacterium]NNM25660.1 cupin domain-containing protein [Phycisphaerales bacterium]
MSPHSTPSPAAELAALYVSGAMTTEERASFEAELDAGNEAYAAALAALVPVAETLLQSIEPVEPSADTRQAIIDAADAKQVWRGWDSDAASHALFTLPRDEGVWEDTGVEGIEVRRLFVDRENNRMTALFRMAAGTAYVPHVHAGPEECFVLEGDLHVGDTIVMHAGDYQRAPAGSEHGVQRTEGGCLLLVSSALDDELV